METYRSTRGWLRGHVLSATRSGLGRTVQVEIGKWFGRKSEMPLAGWSIFNERYEIVVR